MKIYTFYTDTHKKILDEYFLPSFEKTNKDLDLIVRKFDQKCPTGEYESDAWNEAMIDKVDYILESIEETWGHIFIHSDCDVQFFAPIKDDLIDQLSNSDIAAQANRPNQLCCGFFICRSNKKTKTLFKNVRHQITKTYNDQQATNDLVHKYASYRLLNEKYYSVWRSIGLRRWEGDKLIEIPQNILMHHANWTFGINNKIELMKQVKALVNISQNPV